MHICLIFYNQLVQSEVLTDARKALDEDTIEKEVKGPTWLMKLHNYDIIIGTGIDYMHCTLLGVTKQLLS